MAQASFKREAAQRCSEACFRPIPILRGSSVAMSSGYPDHRAGCRKTIPKNPRLICQCLDRAALSRQVHDKASRRDGSPRRGAGFCKEW